MYIHFIIQYDLDDLFFTRDDWKTLHARADNIVRCTGGGETPGTQTVGVIAVAPYTATRTYAPNCHVGNVGAIAVKT